MKNNTNILDAKKWNYGNYSGGNYGAHTIAVRLGERTVYYSYDTVVAFRGKNSKGDYFDCVSVNIWGSTTGKHINWIDGGDKKARLCTEDFNAKLQEFLK